MKFDPSCPHQWIIARWNTQEKYRVAELLMCQRCQKIQSWQAVVDGNHLDDSIRSLWALVKEFKSEGRIDPDSIRGVFLTYINSGYSIPEAMEKIKIQYALYPAVTEDEEKA